MVTSIILIVLCVGLAVTLVFQSHRIRSHKIRAQAIMQASLDAIVQMDSDGRITGWNHQAEKLFGWSKSEVLGTPVHQRIIPPSYRDAHVNGLKSHIATGLGRKLNQPMEVEAIDRYGRQFPVELIVASLQGFGRIEFNAFIRDITQRRQHQNELEQIAHFDALTGLPNRVLLSDRLTQALLRCERERLLLSVVFIDLDGFKDVNDIYGHHMGDRVLQAVSRSLKSSLRQGDTLARIGGDEFVAILIDLQSKESSIPALNRILDAAAEKIVIDDIKFCITASLGVTYYPTDLVDADMLLRHADQALYSAKQSGKNCYEFFDVASDDAASMRKRAITEVQKALIRHEFVLYYQPKVNMQTGYVYGVEALIRWKHPVRGILSPGEFLPLIENHPIEVSLGEWVIEEALNQITTWEHENFHVCISVNIAATQLRHSNFLKHLTDQMYAHPEVSHHMLELEILETGELDNLQNVANLMHSCLELGVEFSIDDFGTGHSSLNYLRHLPASILKIDQSFVRNMLENSSDRAIVQGVIGLAKAFQREVIAEGVENVQIGTELLALGCHNGQGYGIAKPMPANLIINWTKEWKPDPSWSL